MSATVPAVYAQPSRKSFVDLNGLLIVTNASIIGVMLYVYSGYGRNEFVDAETIGLGVVLCLQTIGALVLERRRRDPFVILTAFTMTAYYAVRIVTLTLYPFSTVFLRYSYDANDSDYALIFILIANVLLYAGLLIVRPAEGGGVLREAVAATPGRVIAVLVTAIAFTYLTGSYWAHDNIPRGLSFMVLFLSPNAVVLIVVTYYFVFRKSLSRGISLCMIGLIVI